MRVGRVLGSVLGFAALAGALTAPASSAAPPARIAFAADDAIYAMNADGSARVRLTEGRRRDSGSTIVDGRPAWSPDGATIAFERLVGERRPSGLVRYRERVWVMRADGSHRHSLLPDRGSSIDDRSPTFAPNGEVVFVRDVDYRQNRLIAVDPATGNRRTLVERVEGSISDLAFSPDGKRIVFTAANSDAEGNSKPQLFVMNADGSDRHLLADEAAAGKWSPDGQRIAFVTVAAHDGRTCTGSYYPRCDWHGDIATMDADGGNANVLTFGHADDQRPSWSSDGTRIAFHSNRNFTDADDPEIYSIGADARCLTWLTNGSARSTDPVWAPTAGDPDPGTCGGAGRKPIVDLDLSSARRTRFPVYWLGPVTARGMIASFVTAAARTYFGLIYNDCALYSPRKCGEAVGVDSDSTCADGPEATTTDLLKHGVPSHLSVRKGVLVSDPGAHRVDPQLYAGRTTISTYLVSVDEALTELRRLNRPAATGLPRTAFPDWFWKALRMVELSYKRTHDAAATAKELHLSRSAVKRRLALAKRLRKLGVKAHLSCP